MAGLNRRERGVIAEGKASLEEVGQTLFERIVDCASGAKPCAEQYGLCNDLCIFNPAPIT